MALELTPQPLYFQKVDLAEVRSVDEEVEEPCSL